MIRLHEQFTKFVRPSEHSTFSPSSTDRWTGCPFSIEFTKNIPEEPSGPWAHEGTIAHLYCEEYFKHYMYGIPLSDYLMLEVSKLEKSNPGTAAEMQHHAAGYLDVLLKWMSDPRIGKIIHFGLEVGTPIIPEEGCFGTSDCIIVGENGSAVIDFKYGKGKNVKADTPQLRAYSAGLMRYLLDAPDTYPVYAVIYQPRTDFAPKEHEYRRSELLKYLDFIYGAIQESKKKGLEPVEGSHCFWCPAKRTRDNSKKCPAILARPQKMAEENFKMFLQDMNTPVATLGAANPKRDEAMMKIIALYPMMSQIVKDAMEEFELRVANGENIPGLSWESTTGNRKFNASSDDEVAQMIKARWPNIEPFKIIPETAKLKTITELEKEIGKGKLDPLTVRPIKKTLVVNELKRQSILGDLLAFSEDINNDDVQK